MWEEMRCQPVRPLQASTVSVTGEEQRQPCRQVWSQSQTATQLEGSSWLREQPGAGSMPRSQLLDVCLSAVQTEQT